MTDRKKVKLRKFLLIGKCESPLKPFAPIHNYAKEHPGDETTFQNYL
jgi:hypothetical protein